MYDIQVPLKLLLIKPIHPKRIFGLFDHLENSPGILRCPEKDALKMEMPLEDPFVYLDG